jgi:hypothetical protein
MLRYRFHSFSWVICISLAVALKKAIELNTGSDPSFSYSVWELIKSTLLEKVDAEW